VPDWEDYRADFLAGVPLLQSSGAPIDLEPAGRMAALLVKRLAAEPSEGGLAAEASTLDAQLRGDAHSSRRIVDWLLGDEIFEPSSPGMLQYLGWTAMARYLRPVVEAFGGWRDDERWLRPYCPICGSAAMAQLVGSDPGRKRLLCCGRCDSRWQYKRTGCPFCEGDSQRLSAVTIEGEAGLRIDHCDSCGGYLKTYDGQGNEALLLADWTSLHLDVLAQDRGLKRLARRCSRSRCAAGERTRSPLPGRCITPPGHTGLNRWCRGAGLPAGGPLSGDRTRVRASARLCPWRAP
jgi:FdhE protein